MDTDKELAPKREAMKLRLKPLMDKVANNGPFCTHPDAVVHITVPEQHHPKVKRHQYVIPHELMPLLKEVIERWKREGKVVRAPAGTKFNSPLLVAPKFNKDGKVYGVRTR